MNIYIYFSVFVIVYQLTPLAAVRLSEDIGYEKARLLSRSQKGVSDYLKLQQPQFLSKPMTTSCFGKPLESPYGDYFMSHSRSKRDVAMELLKGVGKVIGKVGWHQATKNIDKDKLLEYIEAIHTHPYFEPAYTFNPYLVLGK